MTVSRVHGVEVREDIPLDSSITYVLPMFVMGDHACNSRGNVVICHVFKCSALYLNFDLTYEPIHTVVTECTDPITPDASISLT